MGIVGSVHFRLVPWSGLYFSTSIGPFLCSGTNDRVLIYCTCHFQGGSPCFSFSAHSTCTLPAHTAQALGCSARNHPRPALGCMHLPGLSHSGSRTWIVLRGADLVGPAFCALPRSEQLWWWDVWWAWPLQLIASPPLSFLGVQPAHLLRRMLTDHPESQEVLIIKEACLQFCRQCLSGAAIAPFPLWLPVTREGWSAACYLCSVLCSVHGPGGVLG